MDSALQLILFFLTAYAAAAISGAAGFGGALLLLPFLVAAVGVTQAVPLLTVAQLVGNLSRAGFGFSQIHWKPVGLFLIGAIPLSVLGALSFTRMPTEWVVRAIGAAILAFVVLQYFGLLKVRGGRGTLLVGGAVVGFLSGLVGSTGPLGAAVFLSLGLPPVAYIASEAVTALAIHGVKTAVYQNSIALDRGLWLLAAVMGAAMVLGTWSAKLVIARIPRETFQRFVTVLLALIAAYMLVHG